MSKMEQMVKLRIFKEPKKDRMANRVGDEILKAIGEMKDVSVVVIGTAHHTKGRGKLAAWLAQQLGQKLFIPLLMVPGNLSDEQVRALV